MNAPRGTPALALLALALLAGGGCRMGARSGLRPPADPVDAAPAAAPVGGREAADPIDPTARPLIVDGREVGRITDADAAQMAAWWRLFVYKDPSWKDARAAWLARGGAAPYVLAENLFRYLWSASSGAGRDEVLRVAESARAVGEPAVGYFANALVLDSWPLKEPVFIPQSDGSRKAVNVWVNDDVTRQHMALVLARIGAPAVPRLSAAEVLRAPAPSARRYALYALGSIATDAAVDAVTSALASESWEDRASAAKALGFALPRNPRAREPLQRAAQDPDPFVRKKAEEALAGKTKAEF